MSFFHGKNKSFENQEKASMRQFRADYYSPSILVNLLFAASSKTDVITLWIFVRLFTKAKETLAYCVLSIN